MLSTLARCECVIHICHPLKEQDMLVLVKPSPCPLIDHCREAAHEALFLIQNSDFDGLPLTSASVVLARRRSSTRTTLPHLLATERPLKSIMPVTCLTTPPFLLCRTSPLSGSPLPSQPPPRASPSSPPRSAVSQSPGMFRCRAAICARQPRPLQ
jgi:hypothetical protein